MRRRQKLRVGSAAEWRALHLPGRPGKIVGDPELRCFVDRHIKSMTFADLVQACRARFGLDRAPSASAIQRYWSRFKLRDDSAGDGAAVTPAEKP